MWRWIYILKQIEFDLPLIDEPDDEYYDQPDVKTKLKNLQLKLPNDKFKNHVLINNLEDLLVYVQTQSDSTSPVDYNFRQKQLIDLHRNNSCLYIDKYFETSIPDPQTTFLLEDQGIPEQKHEAYLHDQGRFWINFCSKDGITSEFIHPNVRGGTYNPYVKFLSSKHSGSEQTKKIMDLVGFVYKKVDDPDYKPVVNLLTFTFPEEIAFRLLDNDSFFVVDPYELKSYIQPSKREETIDHIWNCYKRFFKELHFIFGLDYHDNKFDQILGTSASLHLWSSTFPVLPHPHIHGVLPHFYFSKIDACYRKDVELLIDDLYQEMYDLVDIIHTDDGKSIGYLSSQDLDQVNRLRKKISDVLESYLGLEFLPWDGRMQKKDSETLIETPLDLDLLKGVWTDIVNDEFGIEPVPDDSDKVCRSTYDLKSKYCYIDQKEKLQHYLQYKTRPPVLDLDLYFRKHDLLPDHNKIDLDQLEQDLRDDFITWSLKGVVSKSREYESRLKKIESLRDLYSDQEILEWLRYLSVCTTKTRVFGFWRIIKRYQVSSFLRDPLPLPNICPICGGERHKIGTVNFFNVSYLIKHEQSKFRVWSVKPPPDRFKMYRSI